MKIRTLLIKFSGEALAGPEGRTIDYNVLRVMCQEVADARVEAKECGEDLRICIVSGGGNIMRGRDAKQHGIDSNAADYMGMLATVINTIAIQNVLEQICGPESTRVHTALDIHRVAEPFIVRKVIHQLNEGLIVIFGAGTGNPFFSTDTAAALRASEVGASMWLKATDAEGVFDSNPKTNPNAKLLKRVTHDRCIADKLEVMDQTSLTLSRERNLDICVFSMKQPGNIKRALLGEDIGTLITMAA
jgi:uridylate kinase